MKNVNINKDSSEIIAYDEVGIPIYIREGYLSYYPDYRALCHWHEDIEFICILDGCMNYYINGKNVFLEKGDSIMVNSGRFHYGYAASKNNPPPDSSSSLHADERECHFYCIILHPSLIATNKKLVKKYITPIIQTNRSDYLLFSKDQHMAEIFHTLYNLKNTAAQKNTSSCSYELDVIALFHTLWKKIYDIIIKEPAASDKVIDIELLSQQKMVSFIYQNYSNNLSLEDIAASGNVCRSKCCQIFKAYVGQSPVDFLNAYRLETSKHLLKNTNLSVTDICTACGFNHLSYFTKQFHKKYHCTPKEYRKSLFL